MVDLSSKIKERIVNDPFNFVFYNDLNLAKKDFMIISLNPGKSTTPEESKKICDVKDDYGELINTYQYGLKKYIGKVQQEVFWIEFFGLIKKCGGKTNLNPNNFLETIHFTDVFKQREPDKSQKDYFLNLLKEEFALVNPKYLFVFGKEAKKYVSSLNLKGSIKTWELPHYSNRFYRKDKTKDKRIIKIQEIKEEMEVRG